MNEVQDRFGGGIRINLAVEQVAAVLAGVLRDHVNGVPDIFIRIVVIGEGKALPAGFRLRFEPRDLAAGPGGDDPGPLAAHDHLGMFQFRKRPVHRHERNIEPAHQLAHRRHARRRFRLDRLRLQIALDLLIFQLRHRKQSPTRKKVNQCCDTIIL